MNASIQMTQSLEDYIETVYLIILDGRVAQVRDIARALGVKMPSVVKAIRELMRLELAVHEPYGGVDLTAKGRRVAKSILGRHTLLREFLMKLGVSEKMADRDACLMEHVVSAETLGRIRDFTENLKSERKGAL